MLRVKLPLVNSINFILGNISFLGNFVVGRICVTLVILSIMLKGVIIRLLISHSKSIRFIISSYIGEMIRLDKNKVIEILKPKKANYVSYTPIGNR